MPPENGGYMVAAYVVTAAILLGYVLSVWRRARRVMRER
jgi:heme exporter protein CcmD